MFIYFFKASEMPVVTLSHQTNISQELIRAAILNVSLDQRSEILELVGVIARHRVIQIDGLRALVDTFKNIPTSQREDIVKDSLFMFGEALPHTSIPDIVRLINAVRGIESSKRFELLDIVYQNLSPYFYNVHDMVSVILSIKRFLVVEAYDIISHIKNIIESNVFFLEDSDFKTLIHSLTHIPNSKRDDIISHAEALGGRRHGKSRDLSCLLKSIKDIPQDYREHVLDTVFSITAEKQGSIRETAHLVQEIYRLFLEDRSVFLYELTMDPIYDHLDLRGLLQLIEDQDVVENFDEAFDQQASIHVHSEAAIYLEPIWEYFKNALEGKELLSFKVSQGLIHEWIESTKDDIFKVFDSQKSVRRTLHNLLSHSKFQAALKSTWIFSDVTFTGEALLCTSVTFCHDHPEHIPAFLIQGLYDAVIAFGDDDIKRLNNLSCFRGVAERFLMWGKCFAGEGMLDNIARLIYEDDRYNAILNIDALTVDELKKQYPCVTSKSDFFYQVTTDLKNLKEILLLEAKATNNSILMERVFQTEKIKNMFCVFDDVRDTIMQGRLRDAFFKHEV